jgi:hypothetical protein
LAWDLSSCGGVYSSMRQTAKRLLLVLGIVPLFVGCSGADKTASNSTGGNASKTTQGSNGAPGTIDAGSELQQSDYPVPFYPGSKPSEGDGMTINDKDGKKYVQSMRSTPDSVDQVAAFYKSKIAGEQDAKNGNGVIIEGKTASGGKITISVEKADDGSGTEVDIGAVVDKK